MRNYLVRLGWAHGDQEIFSTEEMIAAFDLPQSRPLAGALRLRQARNLNGHYLRRMSDADLLAEIETPAAAHRRWRELPASSRRTALEAHRRHARPQGARQDAARADRRRRYLFADGRSRSTMRPAAADPEARACSAKLCTTWHGRAWGTHRPKQAVRAFAERKGVKLGTWRSPCARR
jgi:glutamyl-tRNA synthetase